MEGTMSIMSISFRSSSISHTTLSLSPNIATVRPPPLSVVARLFNPAIFEASKLKVVFLKPPTADEEEDVVVEGSTKFMDDHHHHPGGHERRRERKKEFSEEEAEALLTMRNAHPAKTPRAYTLTHSDLTADLTLAISHTINIPQIRGWYNRLQRDEVVAEWRKSKGIMSLHVHCHISGGHCLLDLIAHLRFRIFRKELPVVLQAFRHGDEALFRNHPELEESLVWVYFHSKINKFNIVECWGPLREAATQDNKTVVDFASSSNVTMLHQQWQGQPPQSCTHPCDCCFPHWDIIPRSYYHNSLFQDELYVNDISNNNQPFNMFIW